MTLLLYGLVGAAEALTYRRRLPSPRGKATEGEDLAPGPIALENIAKTYDSSRGAVCALRGASLAVSAGRIAAVVGPSGCGKSTLIRIVAGLEAPDSASEARAKGRSCGALMPQSDSLAPWLCVRDNVAIPLVLAGTSKEDARNAAQAALEDLGLGGFSSHRPEELSGGMRARIAFARTMLTPARAILLDEPFGALDALTRATACDWLAGVLHENPRTTVIVTHDILEAVQLADEVHVMSERPGRVTRSIPIDLPRPRGAETRRLKRFHDLCARVEDALTTPDGRTTNEGTPCH